MASGHNHSLKAPKTNLGKAMNKVLSPIQQFMHLETSSGILLVLITIVAMIWANSPFREAYEHFFHTNISLTIGSILHLEHSLLHWINDGLMVIFFFVVGLEIKRELILGELSSPKKASLPILGAIGGMVVPALIYHFFNLEGVGQPGWGIPMATDIAFAVGVITLLGNRVPFALKVFLLALAIVDDLGAVLVIAIFYTESISAAALGAAAGLIVLCILLNKAGVRNLLVYIIAGIFIWLFFLKSGVHATIAGVILGFITPVRSWFDKEFFLNQVSPIAEDAAKTLKAHGPKEALAKVEALSYLAKEAVPPLDRIVHALHPWVTFFIMPIFALGNAGVYLGNANFAEVIHNPITLGVFFGLLIGKPVGILLACWIGIQLKLASLPSGVNWFKMAGVGFLGGIGFTMALFVSHVALKLPEIETYSKVGILAASLCAAIIGYTLLLIGSKMKKS